MYLTGLAVRIQCWFSIADRLDSRNSIFKHIDKVRPGLCFVLFFIFFLRFYLFIFREGKGRSKREENINVCLPLKRPLLATWPTNKTCALTQAGAQSTEPHQPGLAGKIIKMNRRLSSLKEIPVKCLQV